ncbi:hypothetical protein Pcinc_033100 [Petrolisthes cinctipes]|uniref:Uncharacterized protein n=1 Tax=Petrolisthes cinctipes TaxID=88211 RepID=A0AAE1ESZ4_PETCI|nr:hypothetical protein Pcinc_033100 [Petrolisthes cinctipes]
MRDFKNCKKIMLLNSWTAWMDEPLTPEATLEIAEMAKENDDDEESTENPAEAKKEMTIPNSGPTPPPPSPPPSPGSPSPSPDSPPPSPDSPPPSPGSPPPSPDSPPPSPDSPPPFPSNTPESDVDNNLLELDVVSDDQ